MIWIKTQDGQKLVEVTSIYIQYSEFLKKYELIGEGMHRSTVLGRYSTEAQAKNILDNIGIHIEHGARHGGISTFVMGQDCPNITTMYMKVKSLNIASMYPYSVGGDTILWKKII